MNKREVSWFYTPQAGPASIERLPPYLELYFWLFRNQFHGQDEESKRYDFLSWVLGAPMESAELCRAQEDPFILDLLASPCCVVEPFDDGLRLSNFHYYFYRRNRASFDSWGYSITTEMERLRLLIWYYTWGLEVAKNKYAELTRDSYLERSNKYNLSYFEVSKILELIFDSKTFVTATDLSRRQFETELAVVRVLFLYETYKYPLSEKQLEQLLSVRDGKMVFTYFSEVFSVYFKGGRFEVPVSEMEIHPELKSRLTNGQAQEVPR